MKLHQESWLIRCFSNERPVILISLYSMPFMRGGWTGAVPPGEEGSAPWPWA